MIDNFDQTYLGLSNELRHYRNDKLIRVLQYNNYDHKWQPIRDLKPVINLKRSDKIINICELSSKFDTKSYTVRFF